jgi:hypothetical protein
VLASKSQGIFSIFFSAFSFASFPGYFCSGAALGGDATAMTIRFALNRSGA